MVSAGSIIENQDSVNTFDSIVRNAAWSQIVYHVNSRHGVIDGVTAPTSEYSTTNPASGASVGGIGNDNTTILASTVYNHLNAATYNLTHIRNSAANFYLNINGGYNYRGTIGPRITVRPTSQRQGVPGVNNAGVTAGNIMYASQYNQYCTNLYNQWAALRNNRSDFNVFYCHTSCHTSCHSSRGRR